jgi:hypothetical protein
MEDGAGIKERRRKDARSQKPKATSKMLYAADLTFSSGIRILQ